MNIIKNIFKAPSALDLVTEQREDSMRLYAIHSAAAEHHKALSDMYLARTHRLTRIVNPGHAPVDVCDSMTLWPRKVE